MRRVGRKPEANSRLNEQKPCMRRSGLGESAEYDEARCPSTGRHVDTVGARGRPLVLSGEISTGVPGCPSTAAGVFVGWRGTVGIVRPRLAVEKSAEAVLPAGVGVGGWEGPNAKPSAGTFVLAAVVLIAANPVRGLIGRVQR